MFKSVKGQYLKVAIHLTEREKKERESAVGRIEYVERRELTHGSGVVGRSAVVVWFAKDLPLMKRVISAVVPKLRYSGPRRTVKQFSGNRNSAIFVDFMRQESFLNTVLFL